MKLLLSVFSSLYSRIKIFVFAVNSKRHFNFYFCVITRKEKKIRGHLCRLPSAVNVMLNLSIEMKNRSGVLVLIQMVWIHRLKVQAEVPSLP